MQTNTHFHTLVRQQKIVRHTRLHERFVQLEQQLLLTLCIPDACTQWLKDEACCSGLKMRPAALNRCSQAALCSVLQTGCGALDALPSQTDAPSHPTDNAPAGRTWVHAASSWRRSRSRPRWRVRSCQMAASSKRLMARPSQPASAPWQF